MERLKKDIQYINIVCDIYKDEEFLKLKEIEHHGGNRYEHSMLVSYYSYKISKFLKLDYRQTARAGLLHDFFLSDNNRTKKERFISTFKHSKIALLNSSLKYILTEKEKDIIKCHMFPLGFSIPKYMESWIVSFVDKFVAIYEFSRKYLMKFKWKYVTNIYILLLINFIR